MDPTETLANLVSGEIAPEPAGVAPNDIVHPGSIDIPMPMVVSSVTSAGYTYIYDTRTGDRSLTNRNMLPAQLKKTRADGSHVFTTVKPAVEPVTGTIKCLLNENAPDRAKYAAMGFATCEKANLISIFHLERHMLSKHRLEWASIKDARDKAEKAEDRAFQRELLSGRRAKGA